MKRLVLAALIAASAVAPAAAGQGCIWADQVDGFKKATRDSVVLTIGSKDYLAEFQGSCSGLQWAEKIATVARTSCLTVGDTIRFHDGSSIPQRCMISKLTKVEKTPDKAPETN